jgi:hypothetical protein
MLICTLVSGDMDGCMLILHWYPDTNVQYKLTYIQLSIPPDTNLILTYNRPYHQIPTYILTYMQPSIPPDTNVHINIHVCIYVKSAVLWFPHKNVRFVLTSSCLWDGACLSYLSLSVCSGVQHMLLCCVFALYFIVTNKGKRKFVFGIPIKITGLEWGHI